MRPEEEHGRLALLDCPVRDLQRFARLQLRLVLLPPFDRDDHLDETRIDADRVAVRKEHHVRPPALQEIEDGDAVGDPRRVVADEQEPALLGNTLRLVGADLEIEKRTQMLEGLEARHIGDGIGELDRLAVVEQRVEKGPHCRPQGMADDLLAALRYQRIDDMAGTPLRDQRNRLCKMRQSARRITSRHCPIRCCWPNIAVQYDRTMTNSKGPPQQTSAR